MTSLDKLFSNRDKFISYLVSKLDENNNFYRNFRIKLTSSKTGDTLEFSPVRRYTEQYAKRIHYKLFNLYQMPVYYWLTLTTSIKCNHIQPCGIELASHFDKVMKKDHRFMWKEFYDYIRKYNKEFLFLRTFELTKNNTIHVHIAIFQKHVDRLLESCFNHWSKYGFFKLYRFSDYSPSINEQGKLIHVAKKYEYRTYKNEYHPYHKRNSGRWEFRGIVVNTYLVVNYLLKYMLKNPSKSTQAIFTHYRIRSYAVARKLPINRFTRTDVDKWDIVQKIMVDEETLNNEMSKV